MGWAAMIRWAVARVAVEEAVHMRTMAIICADKEAAAVAAAEQENSMPAAATPAAKDTGTRVARSAFHKQKIRESLKVNVSSSASLRRFPRLARLWQRRQGMPFTEVNRHWIQVSET